MAKYCKTHIVDAIQLVQNIQGNDGVHVTTVIMGYKGDWLVVDGDKQFILSNDEFLANYTLYKENPVVVPTVLNQEPKVEYKLTTSPSEDKETSYSIPIQIPWSGDVSSRGYMPNTKTIKSFTSTGSSKKNKKKSKKSLDFNK